jgi:hypothetical protein
LSSLIGVDRLVRHTLGVVTAQNSGAIGAASPDRAIVIACCHPTEGDLAKAMKDTQVVTLRMPRDVYAGLRALSFATGTSINELVLRALGNYMADEGHRELVEAAATRVGEQYRVALDKLAEL